ncbi:hypothetical protein P3T76_011320 [Phytophthora citrophthora]|uniref:Dynein regulatory complex protein 10 n=1 Tax=Phytophthora citrophthora TaxID=4793 RepID=A0AAD9LFX5_9STRA|nr:hypothetical protein P3T76_011320 [Phytophthora citrophthora]
MPKVSKFTMMLFQGIAWLLLERKTTFYSPRYSQESLSVRRELLPFWPQPQLVLQLGQIDYLVLKSSSGDACKRSGDAKETKKLLQLTVRPLDDVRRAQLYQTAARAQLLEIFVDVEQTLERLLRCLNGEEKETVDPGKKLLDDGFTALERAQKSDSKETAIDLYKKAERSFWEAEKLLDDDRSRELLRQRRGDLQRTIGALEKEVAVSAVLIATPPVAPVVPEVTIAPPVVDISARLEELRRFAAQQDSAKDQVQQDKRTDLTARLAALKNEKAGPAQPVDELAVRLRRLKGDSDTTPVVGDTDLEGKSAVDRIIEQVTDEIALGIEDEDIEEEEEKESDTDDKNERSSSSEASADSSVSSRNGSTMEYAVRLDGERLVGVLEEAVHDLELLAILPDTEPPNEKNFQPAVRDALHRQLTRCQWVVEAALVHFTALQNSQENDRPETEDVGDSDADEEEFQQHIETSSPLSGSVATRLFPKSLHQLLQELKEDRAARDILRKLSATSVSPAISRLTEAWMQLIINTDTALSTSYEHNERLALNIRDSMLRLREVEDDRDQVSFELTQAREARANMSEKLTTQRSRLEAQLRDTKRAADDILGPTARDREEHLQAALSSFETQNSNAQEQVEALQRTIARVTQASQQVETDERKHTQHTATELRELIERYDEDMDRLDAEIEQEKAELARLDAANAKFAMHFTRIDRDRRNMIEEQRAIDLAERMRRNREANLFGFVLKMQAVVRGFLTRKRVRLEEQRKKRRSKKGKKGAKSKKRASKSPRRKKTGKRTSVKTKPKKV